MDQQTVRANAGTPEAVQRDACRTAGTSDGSSFVSRCGVDCAGERGRSSVSLPTLRTAGWWGRLGRQSGKAAGGRAGASGSTAASAPEDNLI